MLIGRVYRPFKAEVKVAADAPNGRPYPYITRVSPTVRTQQLGIVLQLLAGFLEGWQWLRRRNFQRTRRTYVEPFDELAVHRIPLFLKHINLQAYIGSEVGESRA